MSRACIALIVVVAACKSSSEPDFNHAKQESPRPASAQRTKAAASSKLASAEWVRAKETVDGYEVIRARESDVRRRQAEAQKRAQQAQHLVRVPTTPDPHGGRFELKEALAGLSPRGTLVATIETAMGTLDCELLEKKAPITVANFVGIARGLRKFWDAREAAWVKRKYYDGTVFHRVIPGFMIQGGDYLGNGSGSTGYKFKDELHPSLKHDKAGLLCMANRGPNTNAAQFFITDAAAPHLDRSYTIFGRCAPTDLVYRIARVPQAGPPRNTPLDPVVMRRVTVQRLEGGIKRAVALRKQHQLKQRQAAAQPKGASKGPSETRKPSSPVHRH